MPDRVPVSPDLTRWSRGNRGCCCPRHILSVNEEFGFDPFILLYSYTFSSISNDYVYAPGGGFTYGAFVMGPLDDPIANGNREIVKQFYYDYAKDWYKTHA